MNLRRKGFYEKILDFKGLQLLHEDAEENWKIYKATCVVSNGVVFLKSYLLNSSSNNTISQSKIQQEVEITTEVDCPFILHSFDEFCDSGRYWIVQEYCSVGTLAQILHTYDQEIEEGWVVSQVVFLLLQALDYLHEKGLVHCGIAPQHVFFNSGKVTKLASFENVQTEGDILTALPTDTITYIAPELLRQTSSSVMLTHKIDVWALGVMTYEILYGITPFLHVKDSMHREHILTKDIEFPWDLSSEFEDFISQVGQLNLSFKDKYSPICSKALSRDPVRRPSAAELLLHPWIQENLNWKPNLGSEDPILHYTNILPSEQGEGSNYQDSKDDKNEISESNESSMQRFMKKLFPASDKRSRKVSDIPLDTEQTPSKLQVVTDRPASHKDLSAVKLHSHFAPANRRSQKQRRSSFGSQRSTSSSVEKAIEDYRLSSNVDIRMVNPTPSPYEIRPEPSRTPSLDEIEKLLDNNL